MPTPPHNISDNIFDDDDSIAEDAELIAYLDGELDPTAAAAVEAELARNPQLRERAEAYKKSFDLLDYLPKPEADPSFTTRTLTRLQPALESATLPQGPSGSQPVVVSNSTVTIPVPSPRRSHWHKLEVAFWLMGLVIALVLGYGTHSAARPYFWPQPKDPEPTAAEIAMIENLPLYIGVDDLDFVIKLDRSNYFDSPIGNRQPQASPQATFNPDEPLEKPSSANRQKLLDLFKKYPATRQEQIRTLHKQLTEQEPAARKNLIGILTEYSLWLDQLPDAERKEILNARDSHDRFLAVERIRERQWRAALPPTLNEKLRKTPSIEDQVQLAKMLRDREEARRSEWIFAQRQWQKMTGPDSKPWPFSDAVLSQQIEEYIKHGLGVELTGPEPKGALFASTSRLSREDFLELRASHDAAMKEGYWFSYGACLLRMAEKHPALPRPRNESTAIVRILQLPTEWMRGIPKEGKRGRLEGYVGRWPDFVLEVQRLTNKADAKLAPLGPTKPGEFEQSFDKFLTEQLQPKLSDDQKKKLANLEGKWPKYAEEAMNLAREKNLSVPKLTLPGPPKEWEKYYKLQQLKK